MAFYLTRFCFALGTFFPMLRIFSRFLQYMSIYHTTVVYRFGGYNLGPIFDFSTSGILKYLQLQNPRLTHESSKC